MPSFIIKPNRDDDFYFMYSTIVDSPTSYGTRQDYLNGGEPVARLDRADANGTSCKGKYINGKGHWYGWDDKEFMVREGITDDTRGDCVFGYVKRSDMRAFCESLQDDGEFHPPAGMVRWEEHDD